jgi:hypothetical protein
MRNKRTQKIVILTMAVLLVLPLVAGAITSAVG